MARAGVEIPSEAQPRADARARLILAIVLAIGFLSNAFYLTYDCPLDLAGDEAHYWDWSRRLDLCYYSKGPLIAYIIRASCKVFDDTMPAVRLPALVLGTGTALCMFFLTRRLFGSDRLALGAVLLGGMAPIFIAGSLLMTIDSPMFFAWALATCFAAIALFDERERTWPWIAAGLSIGIGALAKYGALLWLPSLLVFFLIDPRGRRALRSPRPWLMTAVALACLTPCLIWNARHDWVSFRHVAASTGASRPSLTAHPLEFLGGQIGVIGPTLAVIVVGAVVYSIRAKHDPKRREMLFLLSIGGSFFAINFLDSFFAKTQVNWPAPAYFTLLILTAYFLSTRLRSVETWKPWRGFFYATIVIGIVVMIASRSETLVMRAMKAVLPSRVDLSNLDPLERVRGWRLLGAELSRLRDEIGVDRTFILCDDYQQTAQAAFYTRGQPVTYCAGPYYGKRLSQYDMWPDRRLHDNPDLLGKDAIFVGKGGGLPREVADAFERIERLPNIPVIVADIEVKSFKLYRCHGFKGFPPIAVKEH